MSMRNIAVYTTVAATLLVASAPASAQGTSGLEFLSVPLGARAVALGETYTGIADGIEGVMFNPASVASLRGTSVSLSMLQAPDLFQQSLIALGVPVLGNASLGLSVNHQRFEAIPMTDLDGDRVGEFTPQTLIVGATFGYRWANRLRAGVTAKWYSAELTGGSISFLGTDFNGSASGLAFDLGLTYRVGTGNPLQVGVALLDLGPDPTFNEESDRLPTRFRMGMAVQPLTLFGAAALDKLDLMLASDGVVITEESGRNQFSLGYGIELGLAEIVYLRVGVPADLGAYDSRPLRYGFGVAYKVFRFDLARRASSHPVLGQETHLSMSLRF